MRMFILFLMCSIGMAQATESYAQNTLISVHVDGQTVGDVLTLIEEQSEFGFFYNNNHVDLNRTVSIAADSRKIFDVLDQLFQGTDVHYSVLDRKIILSTELASAQQQQGQRVTGRVTDTDGVPLIGASIQIKGTSQGSITDVDGNFSLTAATGVTLVFSYIGYVSQEVTVAQQQRPLVIALRVDAETLDEVVVIGYGTVKKSHLTGAVSSISGKEMQAGVARSAASALQGRVAGVTVSTNTGQPGQAMSINVRGISSLSSTTPLFVIDGVYGDINVLDPADIQSIEVLKDASAAAIYGSRAANGVILITTRGGQRETPTRVTIDAYAGVQNVARKLEVMNGDQYRDFARLYNINQDVSAVTGWSGKGTDWQDELFDQAFLSKVNLNVSGGSRTASYNVSASYIKQDGIIKTTGYEGWNLRNKNSFSFFDNHVRMGNTFTIRIGRTDYDNFETSQLTNILPMQKVYDYDHPDFPGHWGMTPTWGKPAGNPVGDVEAHDNRRYNIDLMLNGWAEVDLFLKGLKYRLNVGVNRYTNRNYSDVVPYYFSAQAQQTQTQLDESTGWQSEWLIENTLHYDNTFGKHNLSVVAGYSAQRTDYRDFSAGTKDMPQGLHVIGAGSSTEAVSGGSTWRESLVSMFARAMYSYDDRYLASISIRRDGSSKFAPGHKWGSFPSASVGWNMANESFFEPLRNTVNQLKLRVGYGVLGNLNGIARYATQSTPAMGLNGVFGNTWYSNGSITGVSWTSPAQTTWEQTQTLNIGADFALWNNRLTFTADYFIQDTKDMLLSIPQPGSFGQDGSPTLNAGNVRNTGVELAAGWRDRAGELDYHVSANVSFLNNELTKITIGERKEWNGYNPHGGGDVTYSKLGYPIGGFWLVKSDGIFQSQSEIDAYKNSNGSLVQPNAIPGDLKYIDANGDGAINGDDRQFAGTALPKISLGFNIGATWRGIDLNLFFDGQFGHKLYNAVPYYNATQAGVVNFLTSTMDSWRSDNTATDIPRFIGTSSDPTTATDANGTRWAYTDRWLENGDFLRLKTLELGYTLPQVLTTKARLQSVRIYTAMENLFTLTDYTGFTPDLGINTGLGAAGSGTDIVMSRGCDDGRYPLARTITFGLQVTF
ncbi:MAG: TonB-dependent receptor [Prevotellaceae bacterium]|nr:TonB-dependent receptor [Prevotellaceae bacterium]